VANAVVEEPQVGVNVAPSALTHPFCDCIETIPGNDGLTHPYSIVTKPGVATPFWYVSVTLTVPVGLAACTGEGRANPATARTSSGTK
jgi:hypothetical protein